MNQTIFYQLNSFVECFDAFFLTTRDPSKMGEEAGTGLAGIRKMFWTKLPFEVIHKFY
jgi:hypothetical protein